MSGNENKAHNSSFSERLVIFLDILGFKDRVSRNSHEKLYGQLKDLNDSIRRIVENDTDTIKLDSKNSDAGESLDKISTNTINRIELTQFSDSIILFSSDDSCDSLKKMSEIAAQIMQTAIEKGFPLKGALAKGQVTCDTTKQLFFGQALIDAYLLEENVNYYGIVVHHSAEELVSSFCGKNSLYKINNVFLKSGRISHYELQWYNQNSYIKHLMKENINKIRLTVSDSPRKYIDNTLTIIKEK